MEEDVLSVLIVDDESKAFTIIKEFEYASLLLSSWVDETIDVLSVVLAKTLNIRRFLYLLCSLIFSFVLLNRSKVAVQCAEFVIIVSYLF